MFCKTLCPIVKAWMDKIKCDKKKKSVDILAGCVALMIIMLSKIRQAQKDKCHIKSLISGI